MKKLAMFLGCGVVAFAIGCGEGGGSAPSNPSPPAVDPSKMKEMMESAKPVTPGDAAADPAGEKKEDPAAEKKEDPAAEKKEEAGEKKEEKKE